MSEDSGSTININIKSATEQKFSVDISPSATVADLKQRISDQTTIPTDRQRLIYSGKILKNDDTLESYKIQSGNSVHLVKSAAPPSSSSTTSNNTNASSTTPNLPRISAGQGAANPLAGLTGARYAGLAQLPSARMFGPDGGMGPPPSEEDMMNMMSSPEFRQSVNQVFDNPDMLDFIIRSSPGLQGMGSGVREMMQSPEFRRMMTDPQFIRQMMEFQRGQQGAGAGAASAFPAPGQPTGIDNTNTAATETSNTNNPSANPFAALFPGGMPSQPPPSLTGNGGNPFMSPELMSNLLGSYGGAGAAPGGGAPAPVDNRPPEERYEAQLRQLNELGFYEFEKNVRALRRSGGNVQGAIEALLDGQV